MTAFVAGALGAVVGSFLNVVILRRGVKGLGGRSGCAKCGHTLAWYDLIPVLSWLTLRGRCRYCESRISLQYPLVEAGTGILFAVIWTVPFPMGIVYRAAFCLMAAVLVCIFVYDLHHTIIPDAWAYSFAAIALLCTLTYSYPLYSIPYALASGPIAALPLFVLWAISRGQWMGFGDVKLGLGIGWLLGSIPGVFAVFLSFVLGSVTLVPIVLWDRYVTHSGRKHSGVGGLTMKSEVPFGPFLVVSTLIVWISALYGYDIAAIAGW